MLGENSIEARFGGYSLPTAIKEANEVITNLSDLVAVETHNADVFFLIEMYGSVTRLPVAVVADSGIHLGFDLTHGLRVVLWGRSLCAPRCLYYRAQRDLG